MGYMREEAGYCGRIIGGPTVGASRTSDIIANDSNMLSYTSNIPQSDVGRIQVPLDGRGLLQCLPGFILGAVNRISDVIPPLLSLVLLDWFLAFRVCP